jgi:hypothetical protein
MAPLEGQYYVTALSMRMRDINSRLARISVTDHDWTLMTKLGLYLMSRAGDFVAR